MRKFLLMAIAMAAVGFNAPAKADVIYNLTLAGGGTAELVLNFSSLAAAENTNYTSIAPYFVSLTANVDGQNFAINAGNLADGAIQTGSSGQFYTLTIEETQPSGVPAGTDFLDIYTNTWQLHNTPYDATVASGGLTVGSPSLAVTVGSSSVVAPEPSSLAIMITGFCGLCFSIYRKQRGSRRAVSMG